MIKIFVLVALLSIQLGCSSYIKHDRNIVDSSFIHKVNTRNSSPVLITADLQTHFLYNSIDTRNNFINGFSESIRPAAADLFAPDNFFNTINEYKKSFPLGKTIILGDVLDVSCDWEANKFFKAMNKQSNWVLAPGNHDFIFLGTHEKEERVNDWKKGCAEKNKHDGRFNKVEFIFTYLEALSTQAKLPDSDPSYSKFSKCFTDIRKDRNAEHDCLYKIKKQPKRKCPAFLGVGNEWVNCNIASNIPNRLKDIPNQGWWKNNNSNEFIQDIFWYINPSDKDNDSSKEPYYAYSFILQRIRLPDGRYAILLDTNNPGGLRSVLSFPIGYNPANSANMLYNQMNAASFLMGGNKIFKGYKENKGNIINSNDEHVLMSHHPINDYKWEARKGLCLLTGVGNVNTMYTAHTHKPSNQTHKRLHWRLNGCNNIKEYNIGSMIDAPLGYLLLIENNGEIQSRSVDLSIELENVCKDVKYKWKRLKSDKNYYTSYDDLGWFTTEQKVHKNLINSTISHFMDMLNEAEGFSTISNNWPSDLNSDAKIKDELLNIKNKINNGHTPQEFRERLIELDEFFSTRQVQNMNNLRKYKSCQLHWAANAKKEL